MPDRAPQLRHRMAPQLRHRMLVALGVVDRHRLGQHNQQSHAGDGVPGVDLKRDKLKLAGRILLDGDEKLVSSGKLDGDDGVVRTAVTLRGGRPSLRIAVDISDDGLPKWTGNAPRTAEIQAERELIEAELAQLDEDDPRYDRLIDKRNDLGEGDWFTARLDEESSRQLHARLGAALAAATDVEKRERMRWDKIDRLERERDKLRGMGRKWTEKEDARWDSLTEQIEALEAGTDDASVSEFDEEGVVPGDWGDVHYHVYFEEVYTGARVLLGVRPHGVDADWENGREWKGTFDATETSRIMRLIDVDKS